MDNTTRFNNDLKFLKYDKIFLCNKNDLFHNSLEIFRK